MRMSGSEPLKTSAARGMSANVKLQSTAGDCCLTVTASIQCVEDLRELHLDIVLEMLGVRRPTDLVLANELQGLVAELPSTTLLASVLHHLHSLGFKLETQPEVGFRPVRIDDHEVRGDLGKRERRQDKLLRDDPGWVIARSDATRQDLLELFSLIRL